MKQKFFYTFTIMLFIFTSYLAFGYMDAVLHWFGYKDFSEDQKYKLVNHIHLFLISYALLLVSLMASYMQLISLKKVSIIIFEICILVSVLLAFYGIESGKDVAVFAWGKDYALKTFKAFIIYGYIGAGVVFVVASSVLRYFKKNQYLKVFSMIATTVLFLIIIFSLLWNQYAINLHPRLGIMYVI